MKYLAIFLLAGLGLASAYRRNNDIDHSTERPIDDNVPTPDLELLKQLRNLVEKDLDIETIVRKLNEFGKDREWQFIQQLANMLRDQGEKAKEKILDYLDNIIRDREDSIPQVYGWSKKFFNFLGDKARQILNRIRGIVDSKEQRSVIDIDIFVKLGLKPDSEIVKNFGKKIVNWYTAGKTKAEIVTLITKELVENSGNVSKKMAREGLVLLRAYKDDIGEEYEYLRTGLQKIIDS